MKLRHKPRTHVDRLHPNDRSSTGEAKTPAKKKRGHGRLWIIVLAVLLAVGRAFLPWIVRDYVNRTLDRGQLYRGKIGELDVHLWRGAYSIHDINISKTTGNVPVPFFSAKRVDFAILGKALLHRHIVGRVLMDQPQLNFVDAESESETQTGAGGAWLQMIKDLFPFKINTAVIHDGSIHFRTYKKEKPVDVYLSQVEATIDNLTNIRGDTTPLLATVEATSLAMDEAKFEFKMTLDPFSYKPTFHMATRLLGLDLTKINDLAKAYGKFDFKRGWLDLVIETDSNEGQVNGYVKPLFRNLQIFSLTEDLKDKNILEVFWQALVGTVTNLLKNRPRDQFGTVIPFSADATGTQTDIFATLGNILRNAFVRAYLPRLENGQTTVEGLQFEPPQISDPISPSETE